jgi:hypothetical protein
MMAGRGPFCGDRSVFNLTQEFPMSTDAISPLRELMVEEMSARKLFRISVMSILSAS